MRNNIIAQWAEKNGIVITGEMFSKLTEFQNLVLKVNEKMNLTSITNDRDFAVKHFIDSMTLLPYIKNSASLLDIGTGAGFPGIVLKVLRNDIKLALMDSRKKRVDFLRMAVGELGLSDTDLIPERAEDWAKTGARYDVCTARAVAEMEKLADYALPLVLPGGLFLAMKGPDVRAELEKAKPAIKKAGGTVERTYTAEISDGLMRTIVVIRKKR